MEKRHLGRLLSRCSRSPWGNACRELCLDRRPTSRWPRDDKSAARGCKWSLSNIDWKASALEALWEHKGRLNNMQPFREWLVSGGRCEQRRPRCVRQLNTGRPVRRLHQPRCRAANPNLAAISLPSQIFSGNAFHNDHTVELAIVDICSEGLIHPGPLRLLPISFSNHPLYQYHPPKCRRAD